jgi:hypothetical protein
VQLGVLFALQYTSLFGLLDLGVVSLNSIVTNILVKILKCYYSHKLTSSKEADEIRLHSTVDKPTFNIFLAHKRSIYTLGLTRLQSIAFASHQNCLHWAKIYVANVNSLVPRESSDSARA